MSLKVIGIDEIDRVLSDIAPNHAKNLMRSTIQGIASEIAKSAKRKAPRDRGDLRRAIKAKRRRSPPLRPVSEVMVTHGRSVRYDAFYWRFVEYGTVKQSANPFIKPAEEEIAADLNRYITQQFGKKLEQKLKRERKKANKA